MTERIKFNVIIPTRDRCDTLFHTLRTVVEQRYANLNIIVSDNFSSDETKAVVKTFGDARINYINTGRRVSMSHNWEFALSHVADGWVTFLGDDDGMLPGGLHRIAQVIDETQASAVMSKWRFYFWPGSTGHANRLEIPRSHGYEMRNSKKWMARLIHGRTEYRELPNIYTGGFADLRLINACRRSDGVFFCSLTPDVYSGMALACGTDSYVMVREPICVMGVSAHSNGASNFAPNAPRGPSDVYYSEENIPFHAVLGSARVKSISLLVYECYLQAMHLHGDRLGVRLADQLEMALARSDEGYRPELEAYCQEVFLRNTGHALHRPPRWREAVSRLDFRMREGLAAILRRFDEFTVPANAYHVEDVHGATLLCSHLHRFGPSRSGDWPAPRANGTLAKRLRAAPHDQEGPSR